MSEISATKNVVTHANVLLAFFVAAMYLLPIHTVFLMVGCAAVLTAYVAVMPEQFRNRNGSLTTAIGLVAFMWLAAALIATMTLLGQVSG